MSLSNSKDTEENPITLKGNIFIAAWAISLLVLAILTSHYITTDIQQYQFSYKAKMQQYLWDSNKGLRPSGETNDSAIKVLTGIYVDKITKFSINDSQWIVDFYIWFKWKGNNVDPGNNMQVVNGQILSKEHQYEVINGSDHYEQYEVIASITKFFNMSLFPFDSHLLTIEIEDYSNKSDELCYIPDWNNSSVSPRVTIPGYRTDGYNSLANYVTYETKFGDPKKADVDETIYSRYNFGIWISRVGWGFYFKVFEGLFIAVAVAMISFFINPIHDSSRFTLGIGALFAAVANFYTMHSMQPDTEIMTLADIVNFLGTFTILLILIQSAISVHLYVDREQKALSHRFDMVSAFVFIICYIAVNISILMMPMRIE